MSKHKQFLGLDRQEWGRLAQYIYDAKWENRHEASGIVWDSTILAAGMFNMGLLDKAITEAMAEAERVFGSLRYTKHPDLKKKTCECCGRWEYEREQR